MNSLGDKRLKIWIDGYEANVPQRLGSGQVAFELLRQLEKQDKDNEYTIALPSSPMGDLPKSRNGWQYKVLRPNKLWTRVALPWALYKAKPKPDLIFSPTHYTPMFTSVKKVVTIFDLSYLYFPEMFLKEDLYKLTNWSKQSAQTASHIITISQSTKADIIKFYSVSEDKITVAYPGYNSEAFYPLRDGEKIKKVTSKYGISKDYIIYISTLQPRKNHLKLIESMQRIDGVQLVIVGKTTGVGRKGWMFQDILAAPKKFGVEDKVIFTGFVPDEELLYLLNGAKAYICPSLYEGFGIPIVDAMSCGLPVIVSNVSSMPEVAGDAGLLIDPTSSDQIEQAIRAVTTDKKLHLKLSKASLIQARSFSWDKMAKTVKKVFEEVSTS